MLKNRLFKFSRSIIKIILPIFYNLFLFFKVNRRVINFLEEKSFHSNNNQNFSKLLDNLLLDKKIIAIDVGARGGFNSDNSFHQRYNKFFEKILVEPDRDGEENSGKNIINKGLWSKKEKKNLYLLGRRLGSSSMYLPDESKFDLHDIKKQDFKDFKVTKTLEVDCDTIENLLSSLKVKELDYLKIDTQGAELEILKGLGNFFPLLIKVEAHIHSMYKDTPGWNELINYLHELNYVVIDWKGIGKHNTRVPAEMDMIFIPNFNNEKGKNLIIKSQKKFLSLLLIFGQINLLKTLIKKLNIEFNQLEKYQDFYFY